MGIFFSFWLLPFYLPQGVVSEFYGFLSQWKKNDKAIVFSEYQIPFTTLISKFLYAKHGLQKVSMTSFKIKIYM
jgi:hypothetical protein